MKNVVSKTLLAMPLALALAGAALGCTPEVPAKPTYTNDVRDIFVAHCVRCHGADDMLKSMHLWYGDDNPAICYFNRYENVGTDCDAPIPTDCKHGAGFGTCVGLAASYITAPDDAVTRMPPLPSDRLSDWEMQTIIKWATSGGPL